MLECVIFDLDGLLVDSEPLQFLSYQQAFAKNGHNMTRKDWNRLIKISVAVTSWIELEGLDLDPEKLRSDKKVIYDQMIQEELTLKPGAHGLITELSNHTRLCIASGSRFESIKLCLEKFDLAHYFEAFYSGSMVKRSKPYPDVYLHALEDMAINPSRTIAIEDSPQGLKSAKSAGLKCIVCPDISNPLHAMEYSGADRIVNSLDELDLAIFQKLLLS